MNEWTKKAESISGISEEWKRKAQQRLDSQTRPQGSLGRLEDVIVKLVAIQRADQPDVSRKRVLIFAGDHGVEQEGVSLYPRAVTQAMVLNFLNGGATINALARGAGADVKVVDVGVDGDFADHSDLIKAKVRKGTGNIKIEPAMSEDEIGRALQTGWDMVEQAKQDGVRVLALGEMGIANTTPAATIIAAVLQCPARDVTGRGTGVDDEGLKRKIAVIEAAIDFHRPDKNDPLAILRTLGGFEIAALTGAILACGHYAMPVVVDGVIVAAATLIAYRLNKHILDYVFLAHESEERGHRFVLEAFGQRPLLNLSMRLGEASAAVLVFPLLDAGVRIYNEVVTFEEAEVAQKKGSSIVR